MHSSSSQIQTHRRYKRMILLQNGTCAGVQRDLVLRYSYHFNSMCIDILFDTGFTLLEQDEGAVLQDGVQVLSILPRNFVVHSCVSVGTFLIGLPCCISEARKTKFSQRYGVH